MSKNSFQQGHMCLACGEGKVIELSKQITSTSFPKTEAGLRHGFCAHGPLIIDVIYEQF